MMLKCTAFDMNLRDYSFWDIMENSTQHNDHELWPFMNNLACSICINDGITHDELETSINLLRKVTKPSLIRNNTGTIAKHNLNVLKEMAGFKRQRFSKTSFKNYVESHQDGFSSSVHDLKDEFIIEDYNSTNLIFVRHYFSYIE